MALTLANLRAHLRHALGGAAMSSIVTDAQTTENQTINEAGRTLFSLHPWKYREGAQSRRDFYALSISDATWTNSTLTLTKTSGFATYSFRAGDYVEVTAGTGATLGRYYIASRTSDNAIVLEQTIGSDANGQTDIDFSLRQPSVALPSDFAELVSLRLTDSLYQTVCLTTIDNLNGIRMLGGLSSVDEFWAAISYPGQSSTTTVPAPQLEIYPPPTASETGALTIYYRRGWTELSSDTAVANIPLYMESLLVQVLRAFAQGYEEDDVAAISTRLELIRRGPVFEAALRQDQMIQHHYGPVVGGQIQEFTGFVDQRANLVGDPA